MNFVKVYVPPFAGSVQCLNDDVVGDLHGVMALADHDPRLWMVLLVGASPEISSNVQGDAS